MTNWAAWNLPMRPFVIAVVDREEQMAFEHQKPRLQVRWLVTAAGAVAMILIAAVLVWNVVTAPHPLAQLTTRATPEAAER
jgi:hypothetical protein